jgi:hypothetical protein
VTKSLEASPALKNGGRGFEKAMLSFKQVLGSFAIRLIVGFGLAHELQYVRRRSLFKRIII